MTHDSNWLKTYLELEKLFTLKEDAFLSENIIRPDKLAYINRNLKII